MIHTSGLGNTAEERQALLIEVLRAPGNETACLACRAQLDDYINAQLNTHDQTLRFPAVALHLDSCLACTSAYARLFELELVEATGGLPQPIHPPSPDLSFLLPSTRTLSERLYEAVQHTGGVLRLALSADLLPLLRPTVLAGSVRAPSALQRYTEALIVLAPDEQLRALLPMSLSVYRDAQQPENCLVEVQVQPPGQAWPQLEGIGVGVEVAGKRYESVTDPWGLASFTPIPVEHLDTLAIDITLPPRDPE